MTFLSIGFFISLMLPICMVAQADVITTADQYQITMVSPEAFTLIQGYLLQHPNIVSNLTATKDQVSDAIANIGHTSSGNLTTEIRNVEPSKVDLPALYPIASPGLTPGKVQSRVITANIPIPIAIVGNDDLSKKWLGDHEKDLLATHAQIMVVNLASDIDRQALQAAYPQLSLIPMNGSSLVSTLGLSHYPVLISGDVLTQ